MASGFLLDLSGHVAAHGGRFHGRGGGSRRRGALVGLIAGGLIGPLTNTALFFTGDPAQDGFLGWTKQQIAYDFF